MVSRRLFLRNISVSSATLLSSACPDWVSAEIKNMTVQDQQEFDTFMSLSRHLTGFSDLDTHLGQYFYVYHKQVSEPASWLNLFRIAVTFSEKNSHKILATLMQDPGVWEIAKAITRQWYSGWLNDMPTSTVDIPNKVKAQAYQQSLAWRAMKITAKGVPTGQLWQNSNNQK